MMRLVMEVVMVIAVVLMLLLLAKMNADEKPDALAENENSDESDKNNDGN